MPAASRHSDVELNGVRRHRLQQVEDVDPQLERRRGGLLLLDGDVARLPEVSPGQGVCGLEVVKAASLV
jgi:hypothetical protein